jgi:hypothetical protein
MTVWFGPRSTIPKRPTKSDAIRRNRDDDSAIEDSCDVSYDKLASHDQLNLGALIRSAFFFQSEHVELCAVARKQNSSRPTKKDHVLHETDSFAFALCQDQARLVPPEWYRFKSTATVPYVVPVGSTGPQNEAS